MGIDTSSIVVEGFGVLVDGGMAGSVTKCVD